jgi:hypothetical protein
VVLAIDFPRNTLFWFKIKKKVAEKGESFKNNYESGPGRLNNTEKDGEHWSME